MLSLMISSLHHHCRVRGWIFFLKIGQYLPKLWTIKYRFFYVTLCSDIILQRIFILFDATITVISVIEDGSKDNKIILPIFYTAKMTVSRLCMTQYIDVLSVCVILPSFTINYHDITLELSILTFQCIYTCFIIFSYLCTS